jgi:nucleolar pre-ribosomal-associated protein 1
MVKAILEADQSIPAIPSIRHLLGKIAAEHGVLVNDSNYFDVLVTSFTPQKDWMPSDQTISFFDNCACRIAQQPVHYEDLVAQMPATDAAACLLPFCIAEQWAFLGATKHQDNKKSIAGWITRFFVLLARIGEDRSMIRELHNQIENATNDAALKKGFKKVYEKMSKETSAHLRPKVSERMSDESALLLASGARKTRVALEETFGPRPKEMETMEGLERLNHQDVEAVVANGRLGQFCRSLSATMEETRREGFMALQWMMKQIEVRDFTVKVCEVLKNLQQSTYSEKGPLLILVGELGETAKAVGFASPLASIFTEFAAEAVEVLNQPSHPMYGKINKFLQRKPSWNLSKFVGYWAEKIFLREPEDDNGHHHETSWLLSLLIRGLRDIEVWSSLIDGGEIAANEHHRTWNCIAEAVFSTVSSPFTRRSCAQRRIAGRS